MTTKTIKGISDDDWRDFKTIAVRSNLSMGELFKTMLRTFNREKDEFWKKLFSHPPLLTENEAKDMEKHMAWRKERGFRKHDFGI